MPFAKFSRKDRAAFLRSVTSQLKAVDFLSKKNDSASENVKKPFVLLCPKKVALYADKGHHYVIVG